MVVFSFRIRYSSSQTRYDSYRQHIHMFRLISSLMYAYWWSLVYVCWRFCYGADVIMVVMFAAVQCFCKIKCKEVCAHAVTLRDTGICFKSITHFLFCTRFWVECWLVHLWYVARRDPKPSPALASALIDLRYQRLSTCQESADRLDSLLMWRPFLLIPLLRIHVLLCFYQLCMLLEKVVFQHLVYQQFVSSCIWQGLFYHR